MSRIGARPKVRGWTAIALLAGLTACSSTPEDNGDRGHCKTVISSAKASPVSGYVTLSGDFYPDETVTMTWGTQGNQTSHTGAPSSARTVLDIGPWTSGSHDFFFTVSCTVDGETVFDTSLSDLTVTIP